MLNDVLNLRKEVAWALSNITAGNQGQIQAVIDAGLLPPLVELVQFGDVKTQKEATWAVSNFTCGGSVEQISLLVRQGELSLQLTDWKFCLFPDYRTSIADPTCRLIIPPIMHCFPGVLRPLLDVLNQNDPKITMVVLDAVRNILRASDKMNQREALCEVLEEMGYVDQLERLQDHENEEVGSHPIGRVFRELNFELSKLQQPKSTLRTFVLLSWK